MDIWQEALAVEDYVIQCRRLVHENPELSDQEDGTVAFRLLNTNYTLGANKAYLKLKESDNARDVISVQWDDDETGIIETITLDNNNETVIYILSGQ